MDDSDRSERCVSELVHERAIETPDAPAIVAGSRTLTYGELDAHASRIASELLLRGAGPEVVVGLLTGRCAEMIAGALAIWKAGAAYLPLDASYPSERLRFIARDARCPLLLHPAGLVPGMVDPATPAMPIDLDNRGALATGAVGNSQDHLAYVIYTSGSTGRPKGVEITHRSLLNLVLWHRRTFGIAPEDRASQIAAVGFDAAVWEIWPYLAAGASVHLPDEAVRTDPGALRDWLLAQRITIGFAPTPLAERLMALEWPNRTSLRILLTGGDVLQGFPPPALPFQVVNNYGPTECTVVATSEAIHPYDQSDRRPTIGRPIDRTQVYILDDELREVPAGSIGEIHIGGIGLARGYRNAPELTAARFVPSALQSGARLYRTGDLARSLPDGRIAFVGRRDDQIKIRGFRIEPAEIVSALNDVRGVAASAVVAAERGEGDKHLVAYVVPTEGSRLTNSGLQEALRARLPEYMVPALYVRLEALPVGPHGKIDRNALPEPGPANTLRDGAFLGPRSPVEERVAGLVEGLLRVERVSVDDNFFLLGGHSLLGTQLIARLRSAFAVELGLRDVFEAPTVAQLSAKVERLLHGQAASS